MEETNNLTLKEKIKSFCNGLTKWCWCKKKRNKLEKLKIYALYTGGLTMMFSSVLLLRAIVIYSPENPKLDNSTSLTSINETKTENSTTYVDVKLNLKNSTTDPTTEFSGICGIMLHAHILTSSFMFLYGAIREYKNLLLPWMISGPPIIIGLLITFWIYTFPEKTQGWAIYNRISGVYCIIAFIILFMKANEYFGLLIERDRVKKAIKNSRPIPPDVLNETES